MSADSKHSGVVRIDKGADAKSLVLMDDGQNAAGEVTNVAEVPESGTDLGPVLRKTLEEYHRECGEMMDAGRLCAMAVDGRYLVIYDRNRFERDTVLGAWQRRWAVLIKRCVAVTINARFADMPFVRLLRAGVAVLSPIARCA